MAETVLRVEGISQWFMLQKKRFDAVCDVHFDVRAGEFFGIVGESGSGKSTLARTIVQALPPKTGRVYLYDWDITDARVRRAHRKQIGRELQLVFQEVQDAVNLRMRVLDAVAEPLRIAGEGTPAQRRERAAQRLRILGLPESLFLRELHELSGGQLQRLTMARALMTDPAVLIADEALSSQDVSMQAQVVDVLRRRCEAGKSNVLIAHDLSLVRAVCDRVAVMQGGRLVECAPTEQLMAQPLHPYTQALLRAIPSPDPAVRLAAPQRVAGQREQGAAKIWTEVAPAHWVLQDA